MTIDIQYFFDKETATFTYLVLDLKTKKSAIIDSVLNYDQYSGRSKTDSADIIVNYIKKNGLTLEWILETHIHADHLSAAHYIKGAIGGKTGIGEKIIQVLDFWVPIFNTANDTPSNGSQFDKLFSDNEIFQLGDTPIKALHTPGHTPACTSYLIEDSLFVGDTLFMPDLGTARTDFPGGSASMMYDSIHRIFSLPDNTKIFVCHDYPPEGRAASYLSTVKEQKERNILINEKITKVDYVDTRNKRDEGKPVPKLLLPAIQTNLRLGDFGNPESNGIHYIKIPINKM
jgi:glyoxylase-like metal-dependent hydrolase (beta-lactamase superfamily II)